MTEFADRVSAIILAGGLSSRMGTCKAELNWQGTTLLEHQINKVRNLKIEDIIISGYSPAPDGTVYVPDIYCQKGPLGGIHAGLTAAAHPYCLVTGIDTPLIPPQTLLELIQMHLTGTCPVTVLSHGDKLEPIIGVYNSSLAGTCDSLLANGNPRIRRLLDAAGYCLYPYKGEEVLLSNCNTPEEYEFLSAYAARHA